MSLAAPPVTRVPLAAPGGEPPELDAPDAGAEVGAFWTRPTPELFAELGSAPAGLSAEEAARRHEAMRRAERHAPPWRRRARLLVSQFRSPAVLLLVGAGLLAAFLGDRLDALVILGVVLVSALLGFWQERGAADAVDALLHRLRARAVVTRGGQRVEIGADEVVPGDVLLLAAGSAVPGDGKVIEANCLFVDESALTGESYPAEKDPTEAGRGAAVFAGTHVVSGTATVLVAATGRRSVLGGVARGLGEAAPLTSFERGVRHFGYLLLQLTLVLVVAALAANIARGRPLLEALLFTLALAVGLAPELLPAIVSVTLARGARRMADAQVIVRRLVAIEEFGGMSVLCVDKTGTLTEGTVKVHAALDPQGRASERVFLHAYLNAALQGAFPNPLDEAIRAGGAPDISGYRKTAEIPYDFTRKRLSVAVAGPAGALLVTKGALASVLDACAWAEAGTAPLMAMGEARPAVEAQFEALSRDGFRCLGVAVRTLDATEKIGAEAEREMTFLGIVALEDPPRADAAGAVAELEGLGVRLKMLTGDNRLVAAAVASRVGLAGPVLTAAELRRLSDTALVRRAPEVAVFAELDPNDKERILRALRKAGETVGFLGDGINDAAALHAADVGISVDSAVDVARQAASVVLLRKSLGVLAVGVREGRAAFGNTLKYVFITMSANFGNMFSMAAASFVAAFLPLLPRQILLINTLSDLPAMAIATDRLDPEEAAQPRRWDVKLVRNFMLIFGAISSAFDLLTFGILHLMRLGVAEFRTAWFLESMASELLILLVIRTRRPFLASRPGPALLWSSVGVGVLTVAFPYLPMVAPLFGFVALSPAVLLAMLLVTLAYVAASEAAKHRFYRAHAPGASAPAAAWKPASIPPPRRPANPDPPARTRAVG